MLLHEGSDAVNTFWSERGRQWRDPAVIWAADLFAPVHKVYLEIAQRASGLFSRGYQLGLISDEARAFFRDFFGAQGASDDVLTLFPPTGTAANRLSTYPMLGPVSGIITNDIAHAVEREATSVEVLHGARVYVLGEPGERLSASVIEDFLLSRGFEHWIVPKVISLSNPSEDGTVYREDEIREIVALARHHGLFVQIDGIRLTHAAAFLGCSLRELTTDLGVDAVALGGSKVGMFHAESTIFLPAFFEKYGSLHLLKSASTSWEDMRGIMKMSGTLVAQSEAASAQFLFGLATHFAVDLAREVNAMTQTLARSLDSLPEVEIVKPVETNVIMLSMPRRAFALFEKRYQRQKTFRALERAGEEHVVVRFMVSHANTIEEIEQTHEYLTHTLRSI